MRRLSWKVITGLVGAAILLAVVVRVAFPPGEQFDPDRWKSGAPDARAGMADRIVATGDLLGKSKSEVFAMLGERQSDPPSDWDGLDVVSYHLGAERMMFSIDSEFLRVEFGPDGRVARCWISSN